MKKQIMILGGYGGVGKVLSRNLLKFTDADITIAGRRPEKAAQFAGMLRTAFPNRSIHSTFADATQKRSLVEAFEKIDLVIISATTPDCMNLIAEAAIETATDVMDILVRGDVVDQLEQYRSDIIAHHRIFITQAGFHPGLPAPIIKYASKQFDTYQTANVVMAMNALFEKPESTYEVIHEVGENHAKILKDGEWKTATYKDVLSVQFSGQMGVRQCFPLQMREIYPLQKELGLSNMGVYAAGFNSFVDNFVFPLAMFLNWIKKGFGRRLCGQLMYWGVKKFYDNNPGIEFQLQAKGIKDQQVISYTLKMRSNDAFDFTAIAVIACLKQYLAGAIQTPNLYLMGNVVDENRLVADLKWMGLWMEEVLG